MWFNGKFNYLTASCQGGDIEGARMEIINVESPARMLLLQFKLRMWDEYEFLTFGFYVKIGQLVLVLMLLRKCDYITCRNEIINEDINFEVYKF
jgi:hypothetical protein